MQVPFTICDLKAPIPLWTLKAAIGRRHWSLTKMVVAYHCTPLNSWPGGTFADMQSMLSLFWFLHFVETRSPNFIMQLNWSLVESIHCYITKVVDVMLCNCQDPFVLALFRATLGRLKNFKEAAEWGPLETPKKTLLRHQVYLCKTLALQGQDRLYQWNDHLQPCFPAWFCVARISGWTDSTRWAAAKSWCIWQDQALDFEPYFCSFDSIKHSSWSENVQMMIY